MLIRPVVMQVPSAAQLLRGEERVEDLGLRGRDAAAMSALSSGQSVPEFVWAEEEWPVPSEGAFWSIAKTPKMVAGVVSVEPVAIAVEEIKPRADYQIATALDNEELEVLGGDAAHAYFCAWVAKQVVLEVTRTGLKALSRARVTKAWSDHALVAFDGIEYPVSFAFFSGHVAGVTGRPDLVDWSFVPEQMPANFSGPSDHAVFI